MENNPLVQLNHILQNDDFTLSNENEEFVETTISKAIEILIKFKEAKIKQGELGDKKLLELLRKTNERIYSKTGKKNMLSLPQSIQKLYLSQRLLHNQPSAFFSENIDPDLLKYKDELIDLVEKWIIHIKSLFLKLNTTFKDFNDEKAFWLKLNFDLEILQNFSISEEYRFVICSLENLGKFALVYSLNILISDSKIYHLCGKFNEFYSQFDFSFLNEPANKKTIEIKEVHDFSSFSKKNRFVSNTLAFIESLRNIKKIPRVIRRSICNNLKSLRNRIVNEAIENFHPSFYNLFVDFSNLAEFLNNENVKDSNKIKIDVLRDLSQYTKMLFEISKGIEILNLTSDLIDEETQKNIRKIIYDKIIAFKSFIKEKEGFSCDTKRKESVMSFSLFSNAYFLNILSLKADDFVNLELNNVLELGYHFENILPFLDFSFFREKIEIYSEEISKMIQERISDLKKEKRNINLCVQIAEMLIGFHKLRSSLKMIISIDELETQVYIIENIFYRTINLLPFDIIDMPIMNCLKCINPCENEKLKINEIALNEIKDLNIEEDLHKLSKILAMGGNTFDKIRNQIDEHILNINFVRPKHELIKMIHEKYKNTVEKYGILFYNEDLEDLLKDLVEFKWRYLSEEIMNLIESNYQRFIQKLIDFENTFDTIRNKEIPDFINKSKKVSISMLSDLFPNMDKHHVQIALKKDNQKIPSLLKDIFTNEKYIMILDEVQGENLIAEDILEYFAKLFDIEIESSHKSVLCLSIQNEIDIIRESFDDFIFEEWNQMNTEIDFFDNENVGVANDIKLVQKLNLYFKMNTYRQKIHEIAFNSLVFMKLEFSNKADKIFNDFETEIKKLILNYFEHVDHKLLTIIKEYAGTHSYIEKYKYHKLFTKYISTLANIHSKINAYPTISNYLKNTTFKRMVDLESNDKMQLYFEVASVLMQKHGVSEINIKSLLNFKLQKLLDEDEFLILKKHRSNLESEIKNIEMLFNDFSGDETEFQANLYQFENTLSRLVEEIKTYNSLFTIYKLPELSITANPEILKNEFDIFKMKNEYIEKHMYIPLKENEISLESLMDVAQKPFKTRLMKDLSRKISDIRIPLYYLDEVKTHCLQKYLDLSQILKSYVNTFDENNIRKLIEMSKVDNEILKYLSKDKFRVLDAMCVDCKEEKSFISNFEVLSETLASQKSDLDLVIKFNRFDLYLSELTEATSFMEEQESMLDLLRKTQESIMEQGSIISKESMYIHMHKYENAKTQFEDILFRSKEIDEKTVFSKINTIQSILREIDEDIYTGLDFLRKNCSRLYFVPNSELIRSIHNHKWTVPLITSIFNIGDLVLENECIVAIVTRSKNKEEKISLINPVKIDMSLDKLVNEFELTVRNTLKNAFVNKIKNFQTQESLQIQKIDIIDELVSEFLYFNEKQSEKTYRIDRLDEYSKLFPDLLKVFPKPKLVNNSIESIEELDLYMNDIPYMFEYYPPTDFIFTFLTAKIFSAIALCKNMCGLILYGPSGTGKTESVKYYCRTIGRPLFIFCCNENCDFKSLENIIIGCVLSRSYVCFDEFNRLKKNVMSSVTDLIFEKRSEIKVFLTMNLGYLGRYELPKTLKSIFGEILVDHPDIKDIIYYYSKNYVLYDLISKLKTQCSKNPSYDFGLRAVKSIFSINNESKSDEKLQFECPFLHNTIFFFMATLQESDREILFQSVKDIVGIRPANHIFTLECIFKNAIDSRNGIIVFGKIGKTSLIKNMAMDILGGWIENGKVHRYNPFNLMISNDSVFGYVDSVSREWKDSIFLRDIRLLLNEKADRWFVFDGPIKSNWIEDFNSVLDDNRQICLVTGERIKIPSSFKFIFETNTIDEATPATLTRVFLINVDQNSNCSNTKRISNVPELKIENDYLFEGQKKALCELVHYFSNSRVVFLVGKEGTGKNTLFKALDKDSEVLHDTDLRNITKPYLLIDNFEESSLKLQEQVREFWEHGEVANNPVNFSRIVCSVNSDFDNFHSIPINSRLFRIPKVNVENEFEIDKFIKNSNLNDSEIEEIIKKFLTFIFNTFDSKPVNLIQMTHFIRNFDVIYVKHDRKIMASYIYFVFEMVFSEFSDKEMKIARRFLENLLQESVFELEFDKSNRFNVLNCSCEYFMKRQSFLRYLLTKKTNVFIKGPRLCGKRYLLKKCLDDTKDVEIYEWCNPGRILQFRNNFSSDKIHVFIMLNETEIEGVDMKFIKQNTVSIDLSSAPKTLDLNKMVLNEPLNKVIVNIKTPDISLIPETNLMNSSDDDFEYVFNKHMQQYPMFCKFENLFKLVCFYNLFNFLREKTAKEYETRRKFLRNGIMKIKEFSNRAHELRKSIQEKDGVLKEKHRQLGDFICILDNEKNVCKKEQDDLEKKNNEIQEEMLLSKNKKEMIMKKLDHVESIFEDSRKNIALLNKSHLSEIKAMTNPPDNVRKTIESVYTMLENTFKIPDWPLLLGYTKKDDFISKIMRFEDCSIESCKHIKKIFIEKYPHERICNSSKTCGILYQWIASVILRKETLEEILPLRKEVEELEIKLNEKSTEMIDKKRKLDAIVQRISEIEYSKAKSEIEISEIEKNIDEIKKDLNVLEEILERFKTESNEWKHIKFDNILENPVEFIENHKDILLDHFREIYIDKYTFSSEEFSKIRKDCVEVSLKSKSIEKAITNALHYKNDLIIKDVDSFDLRIYKLIKNQTSRYDDFDSNQLGKLNEMSRKRGRVIIQSNIRNFFRDETFVLNFKEKFKITRFSNLKENENNLLNLLDSPELNLDDILNQQKIIHEEREKLREEENLRMHYEKLNKLYENISEIFVEQYGIMYPLNVFKEFVEKNKDDGVFEMIDSFINHSFEKSIERDQKEKYRFTDSPNTSMFDISELSQYNFDYTFISDFNDIVFEIKRKIKLDFEVSAGSVENNQIILDLLQENSNKIILVKNIHFLPSIVKSGTNRFIFTIEKNNSHPLISETRIVFVDRNLSHSRILQNLRSIFGDDKYEKFKDLMLLHSIGVELKFNFCLRDIETCIENEEFDKDFLCEILYYNRLDDPEKEIIKKRLLE